MEHEYTFDELRHASIARLREIAQGIEHDAVQGYTQMNKEHLLRALCTALQIEMHAHHEVVGVDKATLKVGIRQLKAKRDVAAAAKDHKELRQVRRRIHHLKRRLHKATI
jgi:CII-binding regulator of phage lambda lysogenization HflD